MGKGYYIVGLVLIGVGGYLLFNKIKSGDVRLNNINQDVPNQELGDHLKPPIEVTNQ
jgi:hypothetical protein